MGGKSENMKTRLNPQYNYANICFAKSCIIFLIKDNPDFFQGEIGNMQQTFEIPCNTGQKVTQFPLVVFAR